MATLALASGRSPQPWQPPAWQALDAGLRVHASVTSLARDPADPQRLYAGLGGGEGLWISMDGGETGSSVPALAGRAVYAVLAPAEAPGLVLAATDAGLYRSTDHGRAWQRDEGLPAATIYALAGDGRGGLLAGGAGAQVYRAPALAAAWQALAPLPGATAVLALAPASGGGILLAGSDGAGLFRSADGGQTWQPAAEIGATFVAALALGPDGGLALARTRRGLFASRDAGLTWQPAGQEIAGRVDVLAFDPASGDLLAGTGDGALYRQAASSGDAFQIDAAACRGDPCDRPPAAPGAPTPGAPTPDAFTRGAPTAGAPTVGAAAAGESTAGEHKVRPYVETGPAGGPWRRWGAGLDRPGLFQALLLPAPGAAGASLARWYAGSETGLYLSDDGGLTWQAAAHGPGHPDAQALAAAPGGALYLGNRDGVYRWDAAPSAALPPEEGDRGRSSSAALPPEEGDRGRSAGAWQPAGAGLPAGGVLALAAAPPSPLPRAGGGAGGGGPTLYAGLPAGLFRSDDLGASWTATTWDQRGVPALLLDPADPAHLWIRAQYERVYETRDGGQTWAARWTGLGLATQVVSLAADPQQPAILYAGANEGFYRSLDRGLTWQSAGPELAGQTVFCLAPAADGRALYAGATAGAYRSADRGQHWARWGEGLEDRTVTAIALDPAVPGRAYAGTKYGGVFASSDGGAHWQAAGPGPYSVAALYLADGGATLYAATDHGVFRAPSQRGEGATDLGAR